MHNRTILSTLAFAIVGLAIFGNTQNSNAVSQSPWITQEQESTEGDKALIKAFSPDTLPAVTLQDSFPVGINGNSPEITKCVTPACLVDVPSQTVAVIYRNYELGEVFKSSKVTRECHAVALYNVGESDADFSHAAIGTSYVFLIPYPDGTPDQLADYNAKIFGFIAKICLNPDRTSPISAEWNNPCSVNGCNTARIAGYLFANGDRPEGARPIHYFRTTVQR